MNTKIIDDVKPENYFLTKDGQSIRNLDQLQKSLVNMSDEIYNHHATADRNDFYNWVRDVYKDTGLATTIIKCKNRSELAEKIKHKLQQARKQSKEQDVRNIIEKAREEMIIKKAAEGPVEKKVVAEEQNVVPLKKKTEQKHQFNNKPERSFGRARKVVENVQMRTTVIDFVFGIIIGVIAIMILKQLF